jgi:ribosomal protein S18 acetylase RimI-like enzyme
VDVLDNPVLDNPVWHALTGPHARFARGDGGALRYPPDVAPFMALPDEPDAAAWDALATLVGPGGGALIFRNPPLEPPAGWEVTPALRALQMVATKPIGAIDNEFIELGAADVPEMVALVERTRPGPFFERTRELGVYLGARDDDGLFAMAGERIRGPGFTEVSAVSTDDRARRQGYATRLVRAIGSIIETRGDAPMLHVLAENESAIRVYAEIGFETRAVFDVRVLRAPG